jgi:CheY-like chemotaxis protein
MRGDEVARAIKADAGLGDILLIAVTGFGQERDKVQARLAGFDHHLTKPVDENMLQRLIDSALTDAQCPG